jgi:hypothetical protein
MDWEIWNLVGITFHTIFQRKSFKRWFNLGFQRAFQQDLERGEGVEWKKELMRWWANLVEKTPVVDGVQRRESELERILIFNISETVVGSNKNCNTFCLQVKVGEWIRSEKDKGWLVGMEGNLGVGWKDGIVGIHGEDHIGRLELLWGIKQAPAEIIEIIALMPFQIQETVVREEDKKLPYLTYFCWKR